MIERSQDPVDRLVRELIETRRPATPAEIETIIERIAAAPFSREARTVPRKDRGASYLGTTLSTRADSLDYHLTKRVVLEEQWAMGTTADDYVGDVHQAVRVPTAQMAVYAIGPRRIAAILAPTNAAVPREHLGLRPERLLLVVYSADSGAILTGYQVSSVSETSIPGEAQWLR